MLSVSTRARIISERCVFMPVSGSSTNWCTIAPISSLRSSTASSTGVSSAMKKGERKKRKKKKTTKDQNNLIQGKQAAHTENERPQHARVELNDRRENSRSGHPRFHIWRLQGSRQGIQKSVLAKRPERSGVRTTRQKKKKKKREKKEEKKIGSDKGKGIVTYTN